VSNSSYGQANLIENLRPLVDSGQIVIHDDDTPWVDLIRARFLLHTTGICWEKIPSPQCRYAEQPRRPITDKAEEIKEFLREYAVAAGLGPDDKCIVVGDGFTSVAFEMSFSTLLDCFVTLFSEPQGTCVIKPDGSWCFVFTFEENMYYCMRSFQRPEISCRQKKKAEQLNRNKARQSSSAKQVPRMR